MRADGDDAKWIDGRMASIVVALDVIHVHCAAHAWDLENVFAVIQQIRVFPYQFLVAFEVNRINLHDV